MKFNKQQRGKIFKNLPHKLKKVFTANETTQALIAIGGEHKLEQKDRTSLGEEVGLVLLGIHKPKNMQEDLYEKLDKEKEVVNEIVRSVQEEIFRPIKGSLEQIDPEELLKQAQDEEGGDSTDDMPIPPPPGGGGDTPSPSYGGSSDPYREPVDE